MKLKRNQLNVIFDFRINEQGTNQDYIQDQHTSFYCSIRYDIVNVEIVKDSFAKSHSVSILFLTLEWGKSFMTLFDDL